MDNIILENQSLHMEFSIDNGSLVGLTAHNSGWKILDRPQLGLSFRLLIPLSEERRNNPVFGEKQKVTSIDVTPDRRSLTFVWDGLISELGGKHEIEVTLKVELTEQQAIYRMRITNRTCFIVENVYCPYLGDIQPPPGAKWFKTFVYNYASAQEWNLWPSYDNLRGYFGVDYPTQFSRESAACGAPMSPYILLRSAQQGLYVGVHAPSSELVAWHTELRPGYSNSIEARVPETPTISGIDVATRFGAVHIPYILPGESRELTPIAMQTYQGGWQQGVDIYKAWRSTWMKRPPMPAWAMEPHAWQQIHINSPEDELRLSFRELVTIGEECAKHGVRAIQLVGWNDGGQDQGNPSHDPDPRLGSFAELKEAIAKIQTLGVKVVLFAKFTWADRATENFRKDLVRLAILDPYGDYYHYQGYQYQTATQLLDVNTKRLIPMCFLSEEYLQVCESEFKKILELGADGILFDECLHHSPALLCFAGNHGHRYGAPVYGNDRKLIERFGELSRPIHPEFLYAGEACYDWELEAYHLSYHRSDNKQHIPLSRYMLPEAPLMTAITGFNDRNMINQCLMYRYIISYEPYNFKGHLDDYPLTVEYGKQMDALRTELRDYFWDGEFRDTVGAKVIVDGKVHHPYTIFIHRTSGQPGVVIANYDENNCIQAYVKLEQDHELSRYRAVDNPHWQSVKDGIFIQPCSAVVVI